MSIAMDCIKSTLNEVTYSGNNGISSVSTTEEVGGITISHFATSALEVRVERSFEGGSF